ncbi:MAG: M23 family metallopeptidase [Thermodesulfobacteriota bacterium]
MRPSLVRIVPAAVLALALIIFLVLFGDWEAPRISLPESLGPVGPAKPIALELTDGRCGLQRIEVAILQNGRRLPVLVRDFPRTGTLGRVGTPSIKEAVSLDIRKLGLANGPAQLEVTAVDHSWWRWGDGNQAMQTLDLELDGQPPVIAVSGFTRYVNLGGSGVVFFRLAEPTASQGVTVGDTFHPGFPVGPAAAGLFVSYLAFPYDLGGDEKVEVLATDLAGNQARQSVNPTLKRVTWKHDRLEISDHFLEQKLPEFRQHYPQLTGSPVEQYLSVNGPIRRENNQRILELCRTPHPEQLWRGRLRRLPRGSPRAGFADHRTYFHNGVKIDEQVHLGVDLASTERAPVPAANTGLVAFADYLGIYGNTVLLDHGQGLFTLYSHLDQIQVKAGDRVEDGAQLGTTGLSGMAGGDHLHFAVLINGTPVNPIEWWDDHWLKVSIFDLVPQATASP